MISLILLGWLTFEFFPGNQGGEFPLFTDFTLAIFLPSFFALILLIAHVINIFICRQKTKTVITCVMLGLAFVYAVTLMEYRWFMRAFLVSISFGVAMIHCAMTEIIYRIQRKPRTGKEASQK